MKNKKSIIIITLIAIVVGWVIWFGVNFAPGSYPYAEEYVLNFPEEEVHKAIAEFKQDHPEYVVPKVTINNQGSFDLVDELVDPNSYWYKFYFYDKAENKILYTWTRSKGKNKTTFAFVGINNGLDIPKWKDINKDFSRSDNNREKKKFEERILNKIQEQLSK